MNLLYMFFSAILLWKMGKLAVCEEVDVTMILNTIS